MPLKETTRYFLSLPSEVPQHELQGLLNGFSKATGCSSISLTAFPGRAYDRVTLYEGYPGMLFPLQGIVSVKTQIADPGGLIAKPGADLLMQAEMQFHCTPTQFAAFMGGFRR